MKNRFTAALLSLGLALSLMFPVTASADGQKVVTLGADLSEEQKTAVMRYFGVLGQNVRILYITNQDERAHLGSYVPIEQIGTRTFSCALVNPTTHGGIQVKTANLNWVTSNMIASTLSTSGVVNCEVLAAAPFEVSGTGALTGIIMAYETAIGTSLDSAKKEIATQELVTTGTIANTVGQAQATEIVNEIKIQVIQNQVADQQEIEQIVNNVVDKVIEEKVQPAAENMTVSLSEDDRALLEDLAYQIAEQKYDYSEVKETLERVEENVAGIGETVSDIEQNMNNGGTTVIVVNPDGSTEAAPEDTGNTDAAPENEGSETAPTESALDEDSILLNTDDTALGENVIIDATTQEAIQQTEAPATEDDETTEDFGFDIVSTDTYSEDGNTTDQGFIDDGSMTVQTEGSFVDDTAVIETEAPYVETPVEEFTPDGSEGTIDEQPYVEQPVDEQPYDEQTIDEQPYDEQTIDEQPVDEQTIETEVPAAAELILGQVITKPRDTAAAGLNTICIEIANDNILPADGTVTVKDAFGGVLTQVSLTDTKYVSASALSEEKKFENGWAEGTVITVLLPDMTTLAGDSSYEISVEGTVAQTTDSAAMDTAPKAMLSTTATVYTDSWGAVLNTSELNNLKAGNTVSGSLIFDETTVSYAQITGYDSAKLAFDMTDFGPEGKSFNVQLLQAGTTEFNVDFYDTEGNWITSETIPVTVIN